MATSTASVTTDTTNYTRIHLILMKGGTLLTKTLFLKRVKDLSPAGHEFTVDEFLGKHRVQILSTSTGRNNEEKLYPPTGTSTNLDEWDLPLYCFILKTVCGLPNINKLDMEFLKTMRNELAHLHDPSLTDADFKGHLITIEPIFARSFQMINDPSFEKEMKALWQKCETGALAVDEVVKVHHDSNRKHIELLSNQVKMMKTQVDMIKNQSVMLQNQTTHQEKIDSALSMLTEIKDRLPPNPDVDIPDVHVIIEVKNCTKEKEKELLDFLVKQFDETISDPECTLNKDFPNLAMYTISEAICKTFQSFLEKGRHLLKVENGSICLTVKCNSISSFVGLIRDYIDGKLLDHLTDLKDAIQKWDGFSYIDFDLIVSPDEITEAILKLAKNLDEIVPKGIQVNVPPDELSSSTMFDPSTSKEDTLTSCSTSSIFRLEIKPETDDQRTEIEKCFSSGSISERFEQCQRQLRKDPHFTNVEIEAKLLAVDSPRTGTDGKSNTQKEILTDNVIQDQVNKPNGGGDEKEKKSSKEMSNKLGEKIQGAGEPGRNFYKKAYDNSLDEIIVAALNDEMKSVGVLISFGNIVGTVYRVGTQYVMTALHVVIAVIDPLKSGQPDTNKLQDQHTFVHFNAHAVNPPKKFYFLSKEFVGNADLDVAVLKIVNADSLPGRMPLLSYEVNPNKISLIGFGHPEKSNKKCLETGCNIIKLNSHRIRECKTWLNQISLELIENHMDAELIKGAYTGIDDPKKLIFDCVMEYGASGAPVLAHDEQSVYVIAMLTHGLPSFFFDLPEHLKCRVDHKYRVEVASKMKYIFDWLISINPALAQDIFSSNRLVE